MPRPITFYPSVVILRGGAVGDRWGRNRVSPGYASSAVRGIFYFVKLAATNTVKDEIEL